MVYKKTYNYKKARKTLAKKPYSFKKKTFKSTYGRRKTMSFRPKSEVKYVDCTQVYTNQGLPSQTVQKADVPDSTPVEMTPNAGIHQISSISQGSGVNQRIGKSVYLKKLEFNMSAFFTSTTVTQGTQFRVIIYRDTQTNGLVHSVGEVLEGNGKSWIMNSFRRKENISRFPIYHDQIYTLDINKRSINVKKVLNLSCQMIFRDADLGTGSIQSGSFHVMIIPESIMPSSKKPSYTFNSRLSYVDE